MACRALKKHTPTIESSPDLISDLPQNVIDLIMQRMSLRDAARMSVLSRKWAQHFVSLSSLVFDLSLYHQIEKYCGKMQERDVTNFVSKVLLQNLGPVQKFAIAIRWSHHIDVGTWLSYLSRGGIKHLYLYYLVMICSPLRRQLPGHLFACKELESLTLHGFAFMKSLPSYFISFRNLVTLELSRVNLSMEVFEGVIKKCPKLEMLVLQFWDGFHGVVIDAPNLKRLIVKGEFRLFVLKNVQNLTEVSIWLEDIIDGTTSQDMSTLCTTFKTLESAGVLNSLHLADRVYQYLVAGGFLDMLPLELKSLKFLRFSKIEVNELDDIQCVVGIIKSCPNLEHLYMNHPFGKHEKRRIEFKHEPMLSKLRIVTIQGVRTFEGVSLELMKYLLAISPQLEKLSAYAEELYFGPFTKKSYHLEVQNMSRELMMSPRASPNVEIICSEYFKGVFYPLIF